MNAVTTLSAAALLSGQVVLFERAAGTAVSSVCINLLKARSKSARCTPPLSSQLHKCAKYFFLLTFEFFSLQPLISY